MNTDQLERQLRELPVPDSTETLEHTLAQARLEAPERPAPRASVSPWRRPLLAAGAVALLVVLASLTPPGRAASAWVGDLVGIGEVGGPPSIDEPSGTGVVVDNGRAPDGSRYEWVAYRCNIRRGDESAAARFGGVGLDLGWPGDKPVKSSVDCSEEETGRKPGVFQSLGTQIQPTQFKGVAEPDLVISGATGPAVHRVSIIYTEPDGRSRQLPVDFARVRGELRRLARRSVPLGTFTAFLPGEVATRDEVESRLDLRALETTGKLEVGPIGRRERAEAVRARERCEPQRPEQPTLADITYRPEAERFRLLGRAIAPYNACLERLLPMGPIEYVAYDANGRVLERFRESVVLPPSTIKPAGREEPGDRRLAFPAYGGGKPIVLVSGRAPDGALFELVGQRSRQDSCVLLFWPYVFDQATGGSCGDVPPVGAFGRRRPQAVAARGYGAPNDMPAATRYRVMSGYSKPSVRDVRVVYAGRSGRRIDARVDFARVDRASRRRMNAGRPFGAWVGFLPRSAGPRPWFTVIAVGANGRVLSRERQRG